jgi:hypothetical protein
VPADEMITSHKNSFLLGINSENQYKTEQKRTQLVFCPWEKPIQTKNLPMPTQLVKERHQKHRKYSINPLFMRNYFFAPSLWINFDTWFMFFIWQASISVMIGDQLSTLGTSTRMAASRCSSPAIPFQSKNDKYRYLLNQDSGECGILLN